MKTIKIIDLLNKIANGEEVPRKFTYKGFLWEYDVKNQMWFYYFGESKCHRFDRLFYLNMILNEEVEIIDEPKEDNIKKLTDMSFPCSISPNSLILKNKINEIIDKVNSI